MKILYSCEEFSLNCKEKELNSFKNCIKFFENNKILSRNYFKVFKNDG